MKYNSTRKTKKKNFLGFILQDTTSWNPKDVTNPKRCSLYLLEKFEIIDDPKEVLLDKRSEVISQCRHRNKYQLKNLVPNKPYRGIT